MKYIEVPQGCDDWFRERIGIATASMFDKIITPGGKPCKSQTSRDYQNKLISECLLKVPSTTFPPSFWMERGALLETEAAAWYEFDQDCTLYPGGFCVADCGTYGASPDRLVGTPDNLEGLIEIKCPAPWTHIENLLKDKIDTDYYPQVQGQMLVTGAQWVDWLSFHPDLPPSRIRTKRDEDYIQKLREAMASFGADMRQKFTSLLQMGHIKEVPAPWN